MLERIPAVNQHECRCRIPRVAQHALEIEHVAAADVEVVAGAGGGMDVHWQLQAAAFGHEEPKDKILKRLVLRRVRYAGGLVTLVNRRGLLARHVIKDEGAKVG